MNVSRLFVLSAFALTVLLPTAYAQHVKASLVAADTDAEAERLASSIDLNTIRRNKGEYLPIASPEEAAAYPYTPIDRERIAENRRRLMVGSPATIRAKLMPLVEATNADEVMVTTMVHDHAARRHSYELMAKEFDLSPR